MLNNDVFVWGLTFDIVLSVPLLFWFFAVRTGRARTVMLAPVFLGCLGIASSVLPPSGFLRQLQLLAAPLEGLLLIVVARRVARLRHLPRASDPYERIETAVRELFGGNERVASIVASEIAILYYGLASWREKPVRDERSFTVHERSGWNTILVCLFVLLAAESLGMHLLLSLWSPFAAWIWTAFDLYAALWLLGDYRALVLRPSTIDDDAIRIRFGLRWTVTIARDNIASIDPVTSEADWKRKDVLKVAILDEPRWLIRLREPVVAHGAAGLRKTITAVAILPDQDSEWRVASGE